MLEDLSDKQQSSNQHTTEFRRALAHDVFAADAGGEVGGVAVFGDQVVEPGTALGLFERQAGVDQKL